MKNWFKLAVVLSILSVGSLDAQEKRETLLPTRGLAIGAPNASQVDRFVKFIDEELAPRSLNTLILRVDFNYQYTSHPELRDGGGLSKAEVGKLVEVCGKHKIKLIPQINLLGHQSWAKSPGKLLRVYPEFDETPWVKFPEKYQWPNEDKLYCKSYCPLHPKVHEVVFALVDEICDAFETDAFHAGMDEVFYLGEEKCPRCGGKDKAELFAGEVKKIRDHLAEKSRKLWIWGDRLLDGKTTGLGIWEASENDTHRAVDLIPKDVTICDWHYDRPDPSAVYFAMKGFSVAACPWNNAKNGVQQVRDMALFREHSTPQMKKRFLGVVQTVWSDANSFLNEYYKIKQGDDTAKSGKSQAQCFIKVFEEIAAQGSTSSPGPNKEK